MCQDCSAPMPLATWNPARGVWETSQAAICGHLEPFSRTWPRAGSMRNGRVFERPTPARPTAGSGSSLSLRPTPQAHDAQGPKTPEQIAAMRAKGHGVRNLNEEVRLLPTPVASDYKGANMSGSGSQSANGLSTVAVTTL